MDEYFHELSALAVKPKQAHLNRHRLQYPLHYPSPNPLFGLEFTSAKNKHPDHLEMGSA
jgi:hypothetical protein